MVYQIDMKAGLYINLMQKVEGQHDFIPRKWT